MMLCDIDKKTLHRLPPRALIGRSPRCDLSIGEGWVSGEHAAIRWSGQAWEVRDLGSRNGTRLGDAVLDAGKWYPLEEGALLTFGQPAATYRVTDTTPPTVFAVRLSDEQILTADSGLLVLPDPDDPQVMVHQSRSGVWMLESDAEVRPVRQEEVLTVGEALFRVHLPQAMQGTTEAVSRPRLSDLTLRFSVSADEEYVHIVALSDGKTIDLKSRAHHYFLLTLARLRASDQQEGIDESGAGWVYIDDLTRMLRIDFSRMNMNIFRARKQLAAAGIDEAVDLIERRPSTRQLRLGCASLQFTTL